MAWLVGSADTTPGEPTLKLPRAVTVNAAAGEILPQLLNRLRGNQTRPFHLSG